MHTRIFSATLLSVLFILVLILPSQAASTAGQVEQTNPLREGPSGLMFIENVGQFDDQVRFQVRSSNGTIWLTEDAIWITLLEPADLSGFSKPDRSTEPRNGANIKMSFVGANRSSRLEPFDRLDTSVNYFLGSDPGKWQTNVPVWGGVRYVDLYPGMDLEITGKSGQWQWELADLSELADVRIRIEGANELEALDNRYLQLGTDAGEIVLPLLALVDSSVKYQTSKLQAEKTSIFQTKTGSFEIISPFTKLQYKDEFDTRNTSSQEISNDLIFSTIIGGSDYDHGIGVTIDEDGNIFAIGDTNSVDFPTTLGSFDTSYNEFGDAFILKLSADGSTLFFSTFIGGFEHDSSSALALDTASNIILTGSTRSSDFPTTSGVFDNEYSGESDVYILKLKSSGDSLLFSTFIGGSNSDFPSPLVLDNSGNILIAGGTLSSDFPTTEGAFDTEKDNGDDIFVAKLTPDCNDLVYSTFIGGNGYESTTAMALDKEGNLLISNITNSTDFPTTKGAFDTSYNGGEYDVSISKLALDGTGDSDLIFSTYLGGTDADMAYSIALNNTGDIYVTGSSYCANYPTTPNAYKKNCTGPNDSFVSKLKSDGSYLLSSTYIGGSYWDYGEVIAIDNFGNVIVTGETGSLDFPFTNGAYEGTYKGDECDVVIFKLSSDGDTLLYSTFIGGEKTEYPQGLALDPDDNALVVGMTASTDFPSTSIIYRTATTSEDVNIFIFKLDPTLPPSSLSGHVKDSSGNEITGVSVSAGGSISNTTDTGGQYLFSGLVTGTYTLTPTTSGYFFDPPTRIVTVLTNTYGLDFIGYNIQKQVFPTEPYTVSLHDTLTYTVRIAYPESYTQDFYDKVPTNTTYISNSLLAPDGITYHPSTGTISGTLELTANIPVTITYSVNIDPSSVLNPTLIGNRACIHPPGSGLEDCQWSNEVLNKLEVWRLYLPIIQDLPG